MDDKELLEWAAKAFWPEESEVSFWFDERENAIVFVDADNQDHNGQDVELVWNPLTDDGDALRLAVKLGIDQHHYSSQVSCDSDGEAIVFEIYGTDRYAATRRAIVLVAAAIGQSQQGSKP